MRTIKLPPTHTNHIDAPATVQALRSRGVEVKPDRRKSLRQLRDDLWLLCNKHGVEPVLWTQLNVDTL